MRLFILTLCIPLLVSLSLHSMADNEKGKKNAAKAKTKEIVRGVPNNTPPFKKHPNAQKFIDDKGEAAVMALAAKGSNHDEGIEVVEESNSKVVIVHGEDGNVVFVEPM